MKNSNIKFFKKGELTIQQIRSDARKVLRGRKRICAHCGFDEVVEVCHLKAIKDFSEDDIVFEINSPDNLAFLCPNCHAKLDTGKIKANFEWTINYYDEEDVFFTNDSIF